MTKQKDFKQDSPKKPERLKGKISERKLEQRESITFEDDFGEVPYGNRGDRDTLYNDHHTPQENF